MSLVVRRGSIEIWEDKVKQLEYEVAMTEVLQVALRTRFKLIRFILLFLSFLLVMVVGGELLIEVLFDAETRSAFNEARSDFIRGDSRFLADFYLRLAQLADNGQNFIEAMWYELTPIGAVLLFGAILQLVFLPIIVARRLGFLIVLETVDNRVQLAAWISRRDAELIVREIKARLSRSVKSSEE